MYIEVFSFEINLIDRNNAIVNLLNHIQIMHYLFFCITSFISTPPVLNQHYSNLNLDLVVVHSKDKRAISI